jgi:hypothetical protein
MLMLLAGEVPDYLRLIYRLQEGELNMSKT